DCPLGEGKRFATERLGLVEAALADVDRGQVEPAEGPLLWPWLRLRLEVLERLNIDGLRVGEAALQAVQAAEMGQDIAQVSVPEAPALLGPRDGAEKAPLGPREVGLDERIVALPERPVHGELFSGGGAE